MAEPTLGKLLPFAESERNPSRSRQIAAYELSTARLLLNAVKRRLDKIESVPASGYLEELRAVERLLESAQKPIREAAERLDAQRPRSSEGELHS